MRHDDRYAHLRDRVQNLSGHRRSLDFRGRRRIRVGGFHAVHLPSLHGFDQDIGHLRSGELLRRALTAEQQNGLELFKGKAGCIECHNGPLLTDQKYYNLGVPRHEGWANDALKQITFRYELYAKGMTEKMYRETKDDPGLYFRTKDKRDLGKFRTPSLRYTKYTAPYMHNGAFPTLEAVVAFYDQGGGEDSWVTKTSILEPLNLTDFEQNALVAFLESLSGERITMDAPQLPPDAPLDQ